MYLLAQNLNKYIDQTFINSRTKSEEVWIINNVIPMKTNV